MRFFEGVVDIGRIMMGCFIDSTLVGLIGGGGLGG